MTNNLLFLRNFEVNFLFWAQAIFQSFNLCRVRIFSSTNLFNSFLSGSCIAWGTHLTGSTCGIAPSFSFMLISPSISPMPLNNSGYSNSISFLNESDVMLYTSFTLCSTVSKWTLTKPNYFSESVIPMMAVSCSTIKNLQITDLPLKLSLILHVQNCLIGVLLYANSVTPDSIVFLMYPN